MEPNWKPLEARLGAKRCAGFMFMGRVNGINLYKHGMARMCLHLDDEGQCYVLREASRYEKADFDAELHKIGETLAVIGETLESVYDDPYIAQKREALRRAGIAFVHIEIEPEDVSIN